jgi:two-component system, chemotaxis family, sensor kinase CheA
MFKALLDEVEDTLRQFEANCLRLDTDQTGEEINALFRHAHNLKGAVLIFGLTQFGEVVHVVEDLITDLQKMILPVDTESVDIILSVQRFLADWVIELRADSTAAPNSEDIKRAVRRQIEAIKIRLSNPEFLRVESGDTAKSEEKVLTIAEMMALQSKIDSDSAIESATGVAPLDEPAVNVVAEIRSKKVEKKSNKKAEGSLRIPSTKVDEIMQMVGELSIHQGILMHGVQNGSLNSDICRNAVTLNQKAVKNLQEQVLSLRMQPVDILFQRIERIAREASRELNKKIQVQFSGGEVLLDKTVIELVTDPMNHIIRNAADHGIEDAEARAASGKSPIANIFVKAIQDAGHVSITVSDDGRGIDSAVILKKAIQKGLVSSDEKLTESEIINLIFAPGFSTRDVANQYSGRGVGMDVVQKTITSLSGTIDTRTEVGKGTSLRILLPTTLEIIDGLVISCHDQIYIAPLQDVLEIVDLRSYQLEPIGRSGSAIRLREYLVPVENLNDFLPSARANMNASRMQLRFGDVALIVRLKDDRRLALRIDQIVSQQQIVVRPMSDHFMELPGFSGVTILGDGDPGMILSISQIADSFIKWAGKEVSA